MAIVDKIWLHDFRDSETRVYVKLHPAGQVTLSVKLPEEFHKAILRVAQTAADAHEAQMQAQLLGEHAMTNKPTTAGE